MPRLLIIGGDGQLGQALQRALKPNLANATIWTRADVNVSDIGALCRALDAQRPDAIINACAYTAVDLAESEADLAFALNRDAPAAMAAFGAPLVHVSTDYVFAGDKPTPYVETDPRRPINVYGASKAAGEIAVLDKPGAAVVRTSWVYSPDGANFVKTMLRLGAEREQVSVVADQVGRPTSADDLASACLSLAQRLLDGDKAALGLFHYAGAGDASWADFAEAIFAASAARGGASADVKRITTEEFPTPAKRPANSRLDTAKIEALGIATRPWRDALNACVEQILGR